MKRKLVLLMLPALMLSGCTILNNNSESDKVDPEDASYRPTIVIKEEQKGEEITSEQAETMIEDIKTNLQSRSVKLQSEEEREEMIADCNQFSYDMKVKMDDYYVLMSNDYSKNDKYMHVGLHAEVPAVDLSKTGYAVSDLPIVEGVEDMEQYTYVNPDSRIVSAHKSVGSGYIIEDGVKKPYEENVRYHEILDESVVFDDLFEIKLCDELLFCANQTNAMLQQFEPYDSSSSGGGKSLTYSSSGEGNLYLEVNLPSTGMKMTALFEDYWLKYEYIHIDLRKIKELGVVTDEEMPYNRMTTEISFDFNKANVEYPDLSQYPAL